MKTFDEFLKTITEEDWEEIANRGNDFAESVRLESSPKTALGNQVAAISLGITTGLLQRYHEWLSEQN